MKMVRSVTALVATTMLATSVTPAMAQGFPRGGGYGYPGQNWNNGRHRDRGISAGDVIAGVAVIGIIAAIASAASKSSNANRGSDSRDRGNINSEDQAADACATSVEQQFGSGARVSNIDTVARTRDGYEVRGSIDARDYRDSRDDRYGNNDRNGVQRFTCSIRYGQIEDVRIDNGYAYRGY